MADNEQKKINKKTLRISYWMKHRADECTVFSNILYWLYGAWSWAIVRQFYAGLYAGLYAMDMSRPAYTKDYQVRLCNKLHVERMGGYLLSNPNYQAADLHCITSSVSYTPCVTKQECLGELTKQTSRWISQNEHNTEGQRTRSLVLCSASQFVLQQTGTLIFILESRLWWRPIQGVSCCLPVDRSH